MKLDMKLMRKVLKRTEEHARGTPIEIELCGHDNVAVNYHIGLCAQADYLEVQKVPDIIPAEYRVINLTLEGHLALA